MSKSGRWRTQPWHQRYVHYNVHFTTSPSNYTGTSFNKSASKGSCILFCAGSNESFGLQVIFTFTMRMPEPWRTAQRRGRQSYHPLALSKYESVFFSLPLTSSHHLKKKKTNNSNQRKNSSLQLLYIEIKINKRFYLVAAPVCVIFFFRRVSRQISR